MSQTTKKWSYENENTPVLSNRFIAIKPQSLCGKLSYHNPSQEEGLVPRSKRNSRLQTRYWDVEAVIEISRDNNKPKLSSLILGKYYKRNKIFTPGTIKPLETI